MIADFLTEVANPFPGLRPFEAHETHLFFGRDTATRELLRRLQRTRFLAVVGSSGSGKSSLARAGMLPALRGGLMRPPGSAWRIAVLRPGDRPIRELAEALASPDALGQDAAPVSLDAELIDTTLRRSSLGLIQAVRQARIDRETAVLVVVDQFEELFRFHRLSRERDGGDEAAAFVALLLEGSRQRELPIYVVLTMRSDFLGDCAIFRDLPEAINDGQYLIPRLTRDQLREAVAGPIAVGGAEITPRLLQRLLNDVGDNPDQLPILQHALMRTWERWRTEDTSSPDTPVDLPHYEAIGGMADALDRHAEEAYGALGERDREIARRFFQRVSERGPDNREIRRPTTVRDICAVTDADVHAVTAVINRFREGDRTFVMPPADEPLNADSVVDISHESLIRLWDRLRAWVDEESASAARYRRLAEDAVRHEAGEVSLWRDPELSLALTWHRRARPNAAWADRYHPAFASAMRFLEASRRERDRRVLHRRLMVAALGVAVVVFAALAFVALKQRQTAIEQRQAAEHERQTAERERGRADDALRDLKASAQETEEARRLAEKRRAVADEATGRAEAEATRAKNALADAKAQRDEADAQRRRAEAAAAETTRALADANTQRDEADAQRRRAEAAAAETTRALDMARQQRDVATAATGRAEQEAERARAALAEAQSQRTTSLARLLVADANLLQRDSPNQTDLIMLLATESLRRVRLFDNDRTLREVLYLRRPRVDERAAQAPVRVVAWSPDGGRLAAATHETMVAVWKYPGQDPPLLMRHDKPVRALAWSHDSLRLAVAGEDRLVHIRDAASGRTVRRLAHGGTVVAVAWSADGRLIASAARDRTTRLWEASEGRELRRIAHPVPPMALALSRDGTQVAVSDENETVRVWNTQGGQELRTLPSYGYAFALAWNPDGQRLAVGYNNWTIRVWDVPSAKQIGPALTHQYPVTSLAWSPDGQYLVSGSNDRTARLWEPREGHELARLAHDDNVSGVAWHRDGRLLATSGLEGRVRVWDTAPEDGSRRLVHEGSIGTVAATPDGRFVATTSGDGEHLVRLWNTATGTERFRLTQADRVQTLALTPDGKLLAAGTKGGAILVIDETGRERVRLAHDGRVIALAWSADGQRLASAGDDAKPIVVWDVGARRPVSRLDHGARVSAIAWSPDGQRLASGGDDRTVRVWNTATREGQVVGKHENPVFALAWSADGRRLASGGGDRSARIWDVASPNQGLRLPHQGRVTALAWSADGTQLVTFSSNRAYIWNTASGEELARAAMPGGGRAGVLRTDIAVLSTVTEIDRTLLLDDHPLRAERLLSAACGRLTRNLTTAEWKEFVGDEVYRKTCPGLP